MGRLLVIVAAFCALFAAGCAGSDKTAEPETTSQPTTTPTLPETARTPDAGTTPPRSYRELMARLPPFDEPASREVAAWRKATITAFLDRCTSGNGGAARASFVAINRRVLNETARFPGARLVEEHSIGRRDGNGCPEGRGPATYYTTYRTYRLPNGTSPARVLRHYERELFGWVEIEPTPCERTYGQGPAYLVVSACNGVLRLSMRARAPVDVPEPALPPRPLGVQYPVASNYLATPKATAYESMPGETCQRVSGTDVPSIIVPPPPGVRAAIRGREVVVRWNLGAVHGDCPPSEVILSYPATGFTIHVTVHAASGVTRLPLLPSATPMKLTAVAVSVDGVHGRRVAVLIRQ